MPEMRKKESDHQEMKDQVKADCTSKHIHKLNLNVLKMASATPQDIATGVTASNIVNAGTTIAFFLQGASAIIQPIPDQLSAAWN